MNTAKLFENNGNFVLESLRFIRNSKGACRRCVWRLPRRDHFVQSEKELREKVAKSIPCFKVGFHYASAWRNFFLHSRLGSRHFGFPCLKLWNSSCAVFNSVDLHYASPRLSSPKYSRGRIRDSELRRSEAQCESNCQTT